MALDLLSRPLNRTQDKDLGH